MITKITVFRGGTVGRCQECKRTDGLRFVTEDETTLGRDATHRHRLCDDCADREIRYVRSGGGQVVDGRKAPPLAEARDDDPTPSPHENLYSAAEAARLRGRRLRARADG